MSNLFPKTNDDLFLSLSSFLYELWHFACWAIVSKQLLTTDATGILQVVWCARLTITTGQNWKRRFIAWQSNSCKSKLCHLLRLHLFILPFKPAKNVRWFKNALKGYLWCCSITEQAEIVIFPAQTRGLGPLIGIMGSDFWRYVCLFAANSN